MFCISVSESLPTYFPELVILLDPILFFWLVLYLKLGITQPVICSYLYTWQG